MTDAFLVDLDGVLVDSVAAATRAWTWWASLHGIRPWPFIGAHGRPSREVIPPANSACAPLTMFGRCSAPAA